MNLILTQRHESKWPASLLLSVYIASNVEMIRNKIVIELGAGTALPSVVSCKVGAKRCIITDRADEPKTLQNLEFTADINGLIEFEIVSYWNTLVWYLSRS